MDKLKTNIREDVWISTLCGRCYALCGVRVHRVNGVAVKIEGETEHSRGSRGGLCAKGAAGLQVLYDPNRLNVPLRRTNPEKGHGVDPKWKEITWEEALDEIVPKIKSIFETNSEKLAITAGTMWQPWRISNALDMLGPVGRFTAGAGLHCGDGAHPVGGLTHGSWSIVPDFTNCNYAIYFGASKGHGSGHSAMVTARLVAEARARGMKLVVFDPLCNFAAGKATEWVPIVPGTDAAVVLAMCNVIVNDLGILDLPFLKLKTNAPYLIGPDMKYIRQKGPSRGLKRIRYGIRGDQDKGEEVEYIGDGDDNKPLVWDAAAGVPKAYDDPSIQDYALEGTFNVNGIECRPAFALIKEHLKGYSLEMASKVSTVPAQTIRRIATEFAREAKVGSTISIQGHNLPYRPVSAVVFRGGQGHENSYHTCFAVNLLSDLVGAVEVPGGTTGWPARTDGYPGTPDSFGLKWSVFKGVDGLLATERFGPYSGQLHPQHISGGYKEWPVELPSLKHKSDLTDIQPIGGSKYVTGGADRGEVWKKLGTKHDCEMLITVATNLAISTGEWEPIAEALKQIPFIVSFELFNSELTEGFADIVLPDVSYLEAEHWNVGLAQNFNHAWGMEDWCYHILQPVVEPIGQRRSSYDVGLEILDRLGKEWNRDLISELGQRINSKVPIRKEYALKPGERPTMPVVGDRVVKSIFGPEHDWAWFKEKGFISWPKQVDEAFWMWFLDLRVPIYLEHLAHMKDQVVQINEKTGLNMNVAQYTPLISWFPCTTHQINDGEYEFFCYSYRDVLHSGTMTMEQPWLDEASRMNPYTYSITMNLDSAHRKGIKDGDLVEVETYYGRKATGRIKLLEGQHPQTIGIAATAGHWAKGQPIAKGKGTNFDRLLPMDFEHMDPICGNIETSVKVRVNKIG
ncbi:MAG: molybdopterin-dependent oxidoreductase [Chloroflexi bacterium]|nr:molybdopterin-dependent oxidoreductase [Chloroflexota bacterium]